MRPATEIADFLRRHILISSLFFWPNPCKFHQQIRSIMRQILGITASVPEMLARHRTFSTIYILGWSGQLPPGGTKLQAGLGWILISSK